MTFVFDVITSPTTGRIWMDRNLGASRAATSRTDTASYGDLYQWGRIADGHESRTSSVITTKTSATDTPGHGDFIRGEDWSTGDNDGSIRSANWNPCPRGYRVPTQAEWAAELAGISNYTDAYDKLKLPTASERVYNTGIIAAGSCTYWSTNIHTTNTMSRYMAAAVSSAGAYYGSYRCSGRSVRGIYDATLITPTVSTDAATNVKPYDATLNGSLDYMADGVSFDLSFQYGTSIAYGTETTPATTLTAIGNVTANISGLSANTIYHFRVKITDDVDTWYSDDATFTTMDMPLLPDLTWGVGKGLGPWAFEKCPSKTRYNVGSSIATSEDPTWDTYDFSGEPVTPGHDPCGYWPTGPYRPPAAPPPATENVAMDLTFIAWSPYVGGEHGRFVGIFERPGYMPYFYYSDDGGYTWPQITIPPLAAKYVEALTFSPSYGNTGLFVASIRRDTNDNGTMASADGINWTVGDNLLTDKALPHGKYLNSSLSEVSYNPSARMFFAGSTQPGDWSFGWNSSDGLYWIYGSYVDNFSLGMTSRYRGSVSFDGTSYLYASNYDRHYYSTMITESDGGCRWFPLSGAASPSATTTDYANIRQQAATNGRVILYGRAYFDGSEWRENGPLFSYIDYNAQADMFAAVPWDSNRTIYLTKNGTDWRSVDISSFLVPGSHVNDIAVGYDRAISAHPNLNGLIIVHFNRDFVLHGDPVPEVEVVQIPSASGVSRFKSYKGQVPWTI